MKKFKYFATTVFWIISYSLLGILLFLFSRIVFIISYGNHSDLTDYKSELIKACILGLRFDIKVLLISFLPVMVVGLITLFTGNRLFAIFRRWTKIYGTIVISLLAFVLLIDYYFYSFFKTRINLLIFGFFQDDTRSILKTIWTDFPVIAIIIGSITGVYLIFKIGHWIVKERTIHINLTIPVFSQVFLIILIIGLYFLGMRGTIRMFPLNPADAIISENTFINSICGNAILSLEQAFSDKKHDQVNTDIEEMLENYGFDSNSEAIAIHLGYPPNDSLEISDLMATTPKNEFLEANPPSVVFVLMEGMSNYYMDLHNESNNLLGALESQLNDCYLFRNFLPAFNLTIYTIENILTGTPQSPLSQSKYQNNTFESSVAKPFKEKGYSTTFITGGKMGWRSLDQFIDKQYIERTVANHNLLKDYPNAHTGQWGVHDEHLFDKMFSILEESHDQPQFIFAMTISHHSPYDIPKDYTGFPVNISPEIKGKLKTSEEVAIRCFRAYQYANHHLGQFIDRIRNSPLGNNTIIIATGDHNVLQLFDFSDKDLLMKYSVPLIMYVPDAYKPKIDVNTHTFASHKDIFPSVFNLALSEASYLKTGNNLFADAKDNFGVYRYNFTMDSVGCVDFSRAIPLFFKWDDTQKQLEPCNDNPLPHLQELMIRAKAYVTSMSLFIMNDIIEKTKESTDNTSSLTPKNR